MKLKYHLILASIGIVAWAVFYIIGLPSNYFQDWSTSEKILISLITCFGVAPLISIVTMIMLNQDYIKTGIWLAFYTSISLVLIDLVVCGMIQGGGFTIFVSHWYLTLGYFYVWIIGPLMGYSLKRFKQQMTIENK